jgi:hypothetical protein
MSGILNHCNFFGNCWHQTVKIKPSDFIKIKKTVGNVSRGVYSSLKPKGVNM